MLYKCMKLMSKYNQKWRYVMLCWKIWPWQVAGSVIACTQSVFTN